MCYDVQACTLHKKLIKILLYIRYRFLGNFAETILYRTSCFITRLHQLILRNSAKETKDRSSYTLNEEFCCLFSESINMSNMSNITKREKKRRNREKGEMEKRKGERKWGREEEGRKIFYYKALRSNWQSSLKLLSRLDFPYSVYLCFIHGWYSHYLKGFKMSQ